MVSSIRHSFSWYLALELFPETILIYDLKDKLSEDILKELFIAGRPISEITMEQALSHPNSIIRAAALKIHERESSVITKNSGVCDK